MDNFQKQKIELFQTLLNQAHAHGDQLMKLFASNMFFYYAFDDPKFLRYAEKYRRMLINA